ncbi:MAG: ADP-ribosylglycohydrolase family protein [Kiritimatiellae bacterium]|nr:ADP-ribosylglycohydrolase family protein [Kiritimatiellia bacterium]
MQTTELLKITRQEIKQREEEGCDIGDLGAQCDAAENLKDGQKSAKLEAILGSLAQLAPAPQYDEPSALDEIRARRPNGPRKMQNLFSIPDLINRTNGGWLGRCAGCLLGKPVEGWDRANIRAVAEPDANYPIRDYFGAITLKLGRRALTSSHACLRGQIKGMDRDDDIDYTLTGLLLLERHGYGFTTGNVANFWLNELPYHKVYTAERVAYRNLVDGLAPEQAGEYLNPCREWIGAQIRADAFGYACPGMPELAAELAFRDAYLSHRKNGIYGEMLVAAMLAAAYVEPDIRKIIEIGLSEIPAKSRLAEAVLSVIEAWDASKAWEKVADHIDTRYGKLQGCHTITNAAIVILGLLAGEQDFTAGLAASIMPGYDTDCNGATAGSILGVRIGAAKLPPHWIEPLNDTVRSALYSLHEARISDLARRTVALVEKRLAADAEAGTAEPLTWGVGD